MSTRRPKGTHGSLNKAGKMRSQNPVRNWRMDESGVRVLSKTRKGKKGKARGTKGGLPKRGRRGRNPLRQRQVRYRLATTCPKCRANIGFHMSCWRCGIRLERRSATGRPRMRERKRRV